MDRTQFTFYESFFKAIGYIRNKSARCDAYDALCRYALYGEEPDMEALSDSAAIVFESFRPNLDASRRKAQSGKAGGSSKQTESKTQANDKQTESKKKNKNKNKNKNKDKCLKEGFDLFWSAYPRKQGKQDARKAFEKADVSLDTMLSALEKQKGMPSWQEDGGKYIPYPSTWLNGKRWEDEPVVEQALQGRQLDEDDKLAIQRMLNGEYDT